MDKKVLVAGATGYLGGCIVRELKNRGYWVRVLLRSKKQERLFTDVDDCFIGEVTKPESLVGVMSDIDWVFSSIGITRQKEGLTYMDVDYQGNMNLLCEAKKKHVTKFQYISAINGNKMRHLKIFEAKERFVDVLKQSELSYCVIRPNGFFSDMKDFLEMAKSGRVYLFGDGHYRLNPIAGEDLAEVCVAKMLEDETDITVGGQEILSHTQIASMAMTALSKPIKITYLPDWTRRLTIWLLRTFTTSKFYGPIEFFLGAMAQDNIASCYGTRTLGDFYQTLAQSYEE